MRPARPVATLKKARACSETGTDPLRRRDPPASQARRERRADARRRDGRLSVGRGSPRRSRASAQTRLASRRPAPPAGALSNAFESAVADRSLYLFSLLGPPGVGKSRLVREFVDGVEDVATVLQGRCLPYGRQSPTGRCTKRFAMPVSTRAELGDASATSVQSLFERLAVQRPLVVVLDDLHWAEAALLDGMEGVAESSRGAAILIIAVARPGSSRPGRAGVVGSRTRARPSSNHSARSSATGSSTTSWANPTFPIPFARTSSERPTAIRSSSRSCSRRSSTEIS